MSSFRFRVLDRFALSRFNSAAVLVVLAAVLAAPAFAQDKDPSGLPVVCASVSVAEAVDMGLKNSPMVSSRRAALAAAVARVGLAASMSRPQVSTTTYATASNMPMVLPGSEGVRPQSFTLTPDVPRLDQNLMAMYPLYTGGRIKGQVGSASALRAASSGDAAASELDVALGVKTAYNRVLLARRYIEVYQRRVDEAAERVRIAESAFAEGRIAKYDLLRNQTDLSEAKQMLNDAQKDTDMAAIDLKNTMGISQSSQLTLSQDLVAQEVPGTLEEYQVKALAGRPELAAARARLLSAQRNLDVARSAYKPQIYATAMAELASMKQDELEKGYLVGVTAALPVFDGGQRKSAVDEARAMIEQMRSDEKETLLGINKDVATAWTQLGATSRNVDLAKSAVAQAEEDYRVIRMRYEAGKAINAEVVDALAAFTRAQANYASALYEQNVARDTLTRAIGQR